MSEFTSQKIRTVTLELLRKGPPHNQLLSPLTEYLGICGDAGAGPVNIPYEQASFNAVVNDLRYVDFDEQDQGPRQRALRTLGHDIGEVLGSVPGFTGSLTAGVAGEALINLQIVTSASELSSLPFELAKVPSATGRSTNDWLALQAATPVCVTRRSRAVPVDLARWRDDPRPRVLFIVGLDIDEELVRQHRDALMEALAPWDSFEIDAEVFSQECLVEMSPVRGNLPTVQAIREQLISGFSYVHILAHGAESDEAEGLTYGLYLPAVDPDTKQASPDYTDVLTGDRFASMLSSLPRDSWPSVVVTASCDSANQGELLVPGGSFGHALHEAGVPLVVASQFPLTTEGSVTFTKAFYGELVWGLEPLATLTRVRAILHAADAQSHDWASIVVYDGMPPDHDSQVVTCRYKRAKLALSRAQDLIWSPQREIWEPVSRIVRRESYAKERLRDDERLLDEAIRGILREAHALADRALALIPTDGGYERERDGLLGSHAKMCSTTTEQRAGSLNHSAEVDYIRARAFLEESRRHYHRAARAFLDPGTSKQLAATLHWVLTQAISLDRIFGNSGSDVGWGPENAKTFRRTPEEQAWELAFQSATVAALGDDDCVWGHGTLVELWLLKLFEELEPAGRKRAEKLAHDHATQMARLAEPSDAFPIYSTRRQLRRYYERWTDDFRDHLNLDELSAEQTKRWKNVRVAAESLDELLKPFDSLWREGRDAEG